MKTRKFVLSGLISLLLVLSACNLPGTPSEPSLNDQAATIVALTLNAAQTSTPSRTPQPTNSPTLSITSTPSPTITPTYSVPLLTVNEPTNCRTGPGQSYDVLFTLLAGATVEIVGRYPTNNYWTVKVQGLDEPCWIWGEYSIASGSYWTVPSVTPPATASPGPPIAPRLASDGYAYSCNFDSITTSIKWVDRAEDEQGFRIYRNNELIVELPANSTSFTDIVVEDITETIVYKITAYNTAGESDPITFSFSC